MALIIKGRVVATPPPTSIETKSGSSFAKQLIAVEYGDMTPNTAVFEFDPDRNTEAASAKVGEDVEVTFYPVSIESQKTAGSYFTSLRLFRINFVSPRKAEATQTQSASAAAPQQAAPDPAAAPVNDDLPF